MASGLSAADSIRSCRFGRSPLLLPKASILTPADCFLFFSSSIPHRSCRILASTSSRTLTVCFVTSGNKQRDPIAQEEEEDDDDNEEIKKEIYDKNRQITAARVAEKLARKRSERSTYLIAAMMSSFGITSMAIMAVYYRFSWQMEGGEIPVSEMFGTFALSVGAAVGMEFWARWAHRALWHASLWYMHESHHRPRDGPFELNDVFAVINAVPAISLLAYGFFNKGLVPGLCFGAATLVAPSDRKSSNLWTAPPQLKGLGITVFGMAYMFVHDGLVHRRFPVGPIANVPYLRTVAAAHQIHHSDKFNGVPYGLFLGAKELEEIGGTEELEKEINKRIKFSKA